MSETKLKPCPFCGVDLVLLGDHTHEESWNWWGHPDQDDSKCLIKKHRIETLNDMRTPDGIEAAAWNTRAPDPQRQRLVDALTRIVDWFEAQAARASAQGEKGNGNG